MKTPTELKKELQLSETEIMTKAHDLIENYIEPQIVEAVKNYKNDVTIKLAQQPCGGIVSIPTHKYDRPTPLGDYLVKKCVEILNNNEYDAFVCDDILQISW